MDSFSGAKRQYREEGHKLPCPLLSQAHAHFGRIKDKARETRSPGMTHLHRMPACFAEASRKPSQVRHVPADAPAGTLGVDGNSPYFLVPHCLRRADARSRSCKHAELSLGPHDDETHMFVVHCSYVRK